MHAHRRTLSHSMALAQQPNTMKDPTMKEDDDVDSHVHTTPGPHNHPCRFPFLPPSTSMTLHYTYHPPNFYCIHYTTTFQQCYNHFSKLPNL
ncbi:hypothetical protein VIGAN_07029900 [Vigna angularis var. angularis]|uniref:Uncharacterized protein n=1 Tax=Vigna angularis var. angularis TaxID=157739 RepID=A0A0S3SFS2_PHAAN|nr:hypothetical protein VIGAN_07029900 [Vigna angularis var. angularis]